MTISTPPPAMISAHRSGAELDEAAENKLPTLERAASSECEFVEFDVQRCKDGTFVLRHDDTVWLDGTEHSIGDVSFDRLRALEDGVVTLSDALHVLKGRTRAHVDLKFTSPQALYSTPERTYEVEATRLVIGIMGCDACIITSLEDASVRTVREWSRLHFPELLVGLSLGRGLEETGVRRKVAIRITEIFAKKRLRKSDANMIVANKQLAALRLARTAKRAGIPLLVWTVDEETDLRRWLADPRVWLVTTNYPDRALKIRENLIIK